MSSLQAAMAGTTADLLVPADSPDGHGNRVCLWGPEGVGKTHFMLSRPGPLILFNFEHNVAQVLAHHPDKEVVQFRYPIPLDGTQSTARPIADKFLDDYHSTLARLEKSGLGPADVTLGIDSLSGVKDVMQLAYVDKNPDGTAPPKAYEKFNAKYRGIFVETAYHEQVMICTARASDAWGMVDNGKGKEILGPTGALKADFATRTGHDCDVVVEVNLRPKLVGGKRTMARTYRVTKCTGNQAIVDKHLETIAALGGVVDYESLMWCVVNYTGADGEGG